MAASSFLGKAADRTFVFAFQSFKTSIRSRSSIQSSLRMHSTLQTEVRLTQHIVRNSCCSCARRSQSPRRFFHQSRDFRSSQGSHNNAGSPSAPPPPQNNIENEPRSEVSPTPPVPGFALPSSLTQHVFATGGASDDQPAAGGFYGSSANRKLRSRASKELPGPNTVAPDWFRDNNIILWEGVKASTGADAATSADLDAQKDALQEKNSLGGIPGPSSSSGPAPTPVPAPSENAQDSKDQTRKPYIWKIFGVPQVENGKQEHLDPDPSNPASRYRVNYSQDVEIVHSIKGLVRAAESSGFQDEPALRTSHIILHYADRKGHRLLDTYVKDIADRLGSDLVTLDAQDIAELVSKSDKGSMVTSAGRMLSYETLQKLNDSNGEKPVGESLITDDDFEEDEDDHDPMDTPQSRNSLGLPLMLGKPILIDLGDMFGGRHTSGSKHRSSPSSSSILSELTQDRSHKSPSSQPFANVVEALLSAVSDKRIQKAKLSANVSEDSNQSQSSRARRIYTLIQIKNIKTIQEHSIGGRFLRELFGQVQKRRENGEHIIMIGTECSPLDGFDIPSSKIKDLQRAKKDEISRTIVITPVRHPGVSDPHLLRDDLNMRMAINLRHIWEMMMLKMQRDFLDLKSGFWSEPIHERLTPEDFEVLSDGIWSFSRVHRLCSFISGLGRPFPPVPSNVFPKPWPEDKIMPLISGVSRVLNRSDDSKIEWVTDEAAEQDKSEKQKRPPPTQSTDESWFNNIKARANKHEQRLMSGIIQSKKIVTTFKDVHAPRETVDALQTLTMLSMQRPDAFRYGVLASDKIPGLLLYGPPGTGKTLLAKAVAKESGATMLEVSAAEINDMFVGEGEKNVKALFSLAKKLSPCVVFLDEADAMFSARSNSGRRVSHRELLNQFLKEWDGMSNDAGSAFIMVATNRPMDLDDAVLRRLPRRLLVDLPTEADRLEILKIHLRSEQLSDDISLSDLAAKTPFYSGSDLKNLAVAAALAAVREEHDSFKNHTGEDAFQYPEKRTLTNRHFEKALEEISASISEDMSSLRDIKKFDEQYGDKRGKKGRGAKWGFRTKEQELGGDTVKVRN